MPAAPAVPATDNIWRIAEQAAGLHVQLDPTAFAHYRVAKREADRRNQRRSHFDAQWVVVAPSGKICATGPGQ